MELRKSTGTSCCPLCLLSLAGLLVFCAQMLSTSGQNTTVAADKAGTCPQSTQVGEASGGNCTEECQSDASCKENQKCCPAGCGTSCQVPDGNAGPPPRAAARRPSPGLLSASPQMEDPKRFSSG